MKQNEDKFINKDEKESEAGDNNGDGGVRREGVVMITTTR